MADRRTARATRLLDPLWHWLADARERAYREVEPGAMPVGFSLTVMQGGEMVAYTVLAGEVEVRRTLVAGHSLVDITPPDSAEGAFSG